VSGLTAFTSALKTYQAQCQNPVARTTILVRVAAQSRSRLRYHIKAMRLLGPESLI